jgi:hypothetical protein
MLEILFWLAVGAFIGWNFPQPQSVKDFQAKALSWLKGMFNKT